MYGHNRKSRGFSLVELVIVVVILAIIGAIALPRMSRGAAGAGDSALMQNLSVLRTAIDLYYTEHNAYPSQANIATQLTQYSDLAGATSATKDVATGKVYGPYLRQIPPLSVGANKGGTAFVNTYTAPSGGVPGGGWIYDGAGNVTANCGPAETDSNSKAYTSY